MITSEIGVAHIVIVVGRDDTKKMTQNRPMATALMVRLSGAIVAPPRSLTICDLLVPIG